MFVTYQSSTGYCRYRKVKYKQAKLVTLFDRMTIVLFEVVVISTCFVDVVYWCLIVPLGQNSKYFDYPMTSFVNLNYHIFNFIWPNPSSPNLSKRRPVLPPNNS
eukprot:TRINITY_DN7136_c0_g1_i2.p1 TRINITY_DN7136_c0_g1~~TRINITY_DN7136_c0_g1_i2.p1  ORF type:complete len:104 (-),score=9.10 TRINITY_DN7136_c0_g1_i2:46-357(-)